ncbi:MAG TPA: precorrin-4 C(11)-methyltransferase [bacterium]|jgi:precorrin-4/cobalt-precorrin-4 C11-methyltransferase|nr:precorrin-4 C(11)-methyltransferase [bacterium]
MQPPIAFVGAGPGDPELITLKGARLLAAADLVVHAGSLVHPDVLKHCRAQARLVDSAALDLQAITAAMVEAWRSGSTVVRLHSGDSSIYGATAEQTKILDAAGVPWEIVPGVSSFQAAAALLGVELTLPGVSQSVILTRAEGRSTPMPEGESLAKLGASRATLCLFLSAGLARKIEQDLAPHYGGDCPVAVVVRATWPDQQILRCRLDGLDAALKLAKVTKTAMIIVGRVLLKDGEASKLYDKAFTHSYRRGQAA